MALAALPALAAADAEISPPVSVAGRLQLYSLAVLVPSPGWHRTLNRPEPVTTR